MVYGVCQYNPETNLRGWFFDYEASSPEEAIEMHKAHLATYTDSLLFRTDLPLQAHEHVGTGRGFYCVPCQHAPCKYSPYR